MFLFVHGTGATSSFWLSHIRFILGLDSKYSDRELLDIFTISLPGHNSNDKEFDLDYTEKQILNFIQENLLKQQKLYKDLIFSKNISVLSYLKSEKLIIIGHSIGGAIALNFTLKNINKVSKLVLISSGFQFNQFAIFITRFLYTKIVFNLGLSTIQRLADSLKNLRWKTILNLTVENPSRKGLLLCDKITTNYNFQNLYSPMSLETQLKFTQIPILIVNGGRDFLNPKSSVKNLQTFLNKQLPILKTKKIVVGRNSPAELQTIITKIYPKAGHNPMDDNINLFVSDVQEFLK